MMDELPRSADLDKLSAMHTPADAAKISLRRRRCWRIILVVTAIIVGTLAWRFQIVIRAALLSPLPVVEAARSLIDAGAYTYRVPETSTAALVRIGNAPTPVGATQAIENQHYLVLPFYEDLGPLVLVVVDKANQQQRRITIEHAKFAYGLAFDRNDPHILWVGTSSQPSVECYDLRELTRICRNAPLDSGISHIFGFDQARDGTVFLGAFPTRACLHGRRESDTMTFHPLVVDHPAITSATYLYRIYAADDVLLLSYSAPAVVLRYDRQTKQTTEVLRSSTPFIDFHVIDDQLWFRDGEMWRGYERSGKALPTAGYLPAHFPPQVTSAGFFAELSYRGASLEPQQVRIPLAPSSGGMRITALDAAGNGRLYGATYWNTWLWELDPTARRMRGVAPLKGSSGEFFHSAWHVDRLMIPSYQGTRFEYLPAQVDDQPRADFPRLMAHHTGTHYGLASASLPDGKFVYSTFPNYHRPGGDLVVDDPRGSDQVLSPIGADLTIGRLAVVGARLFGGTLNASGSALSTSHAGAPRLIEFVNINGQEIVPSDRFIGLSIALDSRDDSVCGLVALGDGRLLAATERRMFTVDISGPEWRVTEIAEINWMKRGFKSPLRRMLSCRDKAVLVTRAYLLVYDPADDTVRVVAKLPIDASLAALDSTGLYLAEQGSVYVIPAATLKTWGLDP